MSHTLIRPRTESSAHVLDACVAEGVITAEQAAKIRARAGQPEPGASGPTLALEAAGYLGGVLVLVAAMLLGFQFWDELGRSARLALVGGATVALFLGGLVVPASSSEAAIRLRSALWLASTAATAGFLALLVNDVLDLPGDRAAVLVSSGTSVVAVLLWLVRPSAAQQVAAMAGPMVTAALAVVDFSPSDALPGLAAWLVAAAWAALAWGSVLPRRRLGLALAAAGMIIASLFTIPTDGGVVLALLTTAAVVAAAVLFRDVVLLVIGAMGLLNVLPAAVTTWFPDTMAAPFVLLAVGVALVTATIWAARRSSSASRTARRDWSTGSPRVAGATAALLVGALVALLVATAVVS